MSIDLTTIENDINLAEDIASKLGPFLAFIPGIGPYVGAITAAIPQIVKATKAVEQIIPGAPIGSMANAQAIADHIDPNQPNSAALSSLKNGG